MEHVLAAVLWMVLLWLFRQPEKGQPLVWFGYTVGLASPSHHLGVYGGSMTCLLSAGENVMLPLPWAVLTFIWLVQKNDLGWLKTHSSCITIYRSYLSYFYVTRRSFLGLHYLHLYYLWVAWTKMHCIYIYKPNYFIIDFVFSCRNPVSEWGWQWWRINWDLASSSSHKPADPLSYGTIDTKHNKWNNTINKITFIHSFGPKI